MSDSSETPIIDQIIDRAVEQNPQATELLKAFGPIIARQRQLSATIVLPELDYSTIDQEKLKSGISVSEQVDLFSPADPLKEIAVSLALAVKEGMPVLAGEMDRLTQLIAMDKLRLADYFALPSARENNPIKRWGNDLKISPSNASFLMSLIARVLLERRSKDMAARLGKYSWEKGYCPVCGAFPSIALIEEEGGKRFLHCSSCGQDWRFTRVICPYCEKEAQSGMDYFYIDNRTQESAFVCEKCKKYLVTLYRVGHLFARDMDVSAISLVHLDMVMQDKGYEPMVSCVWNTLR